MIQNGLVTVSGVKILDPSEHVIAVDGLNFSVSGGEWTYREKAYVVLHKPTGYECSNRPTNNPSVFELLPPQLQVVQRVFAS